MNGNQLGITRRSFVQYTVGAAMGTALRRSGYAADEAQRTSRSSTVTLVRDERAMNGNHEAVLGIMGKLVEQSLTAFTGEKTAKNAWSVLLQPGDTIGLVGTAHLNPTHPELFTVVRKSLLDAGIPESRINLVQGEEEQGSPEKAKACTALIALPALKAHWLTGIGTVLKNYIMFSGKPSSYHRENNVDLGEIWTRPEVKGKTRLVLVDALRPLCDKGPQVNPRYLWDYKGLIAGTDPVAVETVCLKIIEEKRKALKDDDLPPLSPPPLCVAAADEKFGLGTSRWEEIKIQSLGWEKDLLL